MERKWGNGERLTLYISSFSLYFLPLSPFPPSLSISYIKMHHILLQNVKYGTFVANVTKISTYALWGNNSGSNLLRGSSAIRAGLGKGKPRRQFISKYAYSHRRVNCKSSSLPNMLMSTGGQRSSSCGGVVKLSFYRSSRGKWATVHWRYTQESTFTEMHHSTTSR